MQTFNTFDPYAILAKCTTPAAKHAKDAKVDDTTLYTLAGLATLAGQAYESRISEWLNTNPPVVTPDTCTHCGKRAGIIGQDAIITGSGHYLHHDCHRLWLAQRRQSAIMALNLFTFRDTIYATQTIK